MKLGRPTFVLATVVVGATLPGAAEAQPASASACDHACLSTVMGDFLQAMTAGKPGSVRLAEHAEVRENTRVVLLEATAWKHVKAIRSAMTFTDPLTGNVLSRAGVELADGKPGYISTRLKVVSGERITEVELSADTSSRVVGAYVWSLDPSYGAVLPPEERLSRVELEALAAATFTASPATWRPRRTLTSAATGSTAVSASPTRRQLGRGGPSRKLVRLAAARRGAAGHEGQGARGPAGIGPPPPWAMETLLSIPPLAW